MILAGGLGTGRIVSYDLGGRALYIMPSAPIGMRPVTCTFTGAVAPVLTCAGAAAVSVASCEGAEEPTVTYTGSAAVTVTGVGETA